MFVDRIPNRNSNPTWLLRRSKWRNGKSVKETLCNLNKVPHDFRMQIRELCRGGVVVRNLTDFFEQTYSSVRRFPHGHVAAALGMLRLRNLDTLIGKSATRLRKVILALIVRRILVPESRLATAAALQQEESVVSLGLELGIKNVRQHEIVRAMNWLCSRQAAIEQALSTRYLSEGSSVMCFVATTFLPPLGADPPGFGHAGDRDEGRKQVCFGLLCDDGGRPFAVELFPGITNGPVLLAAWFHELKERFNISRFAIVGDEELLTDARTTEELKSAGLQWIAPLRKGTIRRLREHRGIQMTPITQKGQVETTWNDRHGTRLILSRDAAQYEHIKEKRERLLQAAERRLDTLVMATRRERNPVRGIGNIALRAGGIVGEHNMAKYFTFTITDSAFGYQRNQALLAKDTSLAGLHGISTTVPDSQLSAAQAATACQQLVAVKEAFRRPATEDLKAHAIDHNRDRGIKAQFFLHMLAFHVQWHLKEALTPLMLTGDIPAQDGARFQSAVAPAQPGAHALAETRQQAGRADNRIASLRTLMNELAQLGKFELVPEDPSKKATFEVLETLAEKQKKAFELLGIEHR